jgi:hypothetical protein
VEWGELREERRWSDTGRVAVGRYVDMGAGRDGWESGCRGSPEGMDVVI